MASQLAQTDLPKTRAVTPVTHIRQSAALINPRVVTLAFPSRHCRLLLRSPTFTPFRPSSNIPSPLCFYVATYWPLTHTAVLDGCPTPETRLRLERR